MEPHIRFTILKLVSPWISVLTLTLSKSPVKGTYLLTLAQHFSVSDYESSDTYCYTPKEICEYIERKL